LGLAGGGITPTDRCSNGKTSGKEKLMTERERSADPGGTQDNLGDELDEATKRANPEESATREAVEEEERTGGPGGVKDNVKDEGEESQRR
jgi:hypothetical protein